MFKETFISQIEGEEETPATPEGGEEEKEEEEGEGEGEGGAQKEKKEGGETN